jgi:hypothetical protein
MQSPLLTFLLAVLLVLALAAAILIATVIFHCGRKHSSKPPQNTEE